MNNTKFDSLGEWFRLEQGDINVNQNLTREKKIELGKKFTSKPKHALYELRAVLTRLPFRDRRDVDSFYEEKGGSLLKEYNLRFIAKDLTGRDKNLSKLVKYFNEKVTVTNDKPITHVDELGEAIKTQVTNEHIRFNLLNETGKSWMKTRGIKKGDIKNADAAQLNEWNNIRTNILALKAAPQEWKDVLRLNDIEIEGLSKENLELIGRALQVSVNVEIPPTIAAKIFQKSNIHLVGNLDVEYLHSLQAFKVLEESQPQFTQRSENTPWLYPLLKFVSNQGINDAELSEDREALIINLVKLTMNIAWVEEDQSSEEKNAENLKAARFVNMMTENQNFVLCLSRIDRVGRSTTTNHVKSLVEIIYELSPNQDQFISWLQNNIEEQKNNLGGVRESYIDSLHRVIKEMGGEPLSDHVSANITSIKDKQSIANQYSKINTDSQGIVSRENLDGYIARRLGEDANPQTIANEITQKFQAVAEAKARYEFLEDGDAFVNFLAQPEGNILVEDLLAMKVVFGQERWMELKADVEKLSPELAKSIANQVQEHGLHPYEVDQYIKFKNNKSYIDLVKSLGIKVPDKLFDAIDNRQVQETLGLLASQKKLAVKYGLEKEFTDFLKANFKQKDDSIFVNDLQEAMQAYENIHNNLNDLEELRTQRLEGEHVEIGQSEINLDIFEKGMSNAIRKAINSGASFEYAVINTYNESNFEIARAFNALNASIQLIKTDKPNLEESFNRDALLLSFVKRGQTLLEAIQSTQHVLGQYRDQPMTDAKRMEELQAIGGAYLKGKYVEYATKGVNFHPGEATLNIPQDMETAQVMQLMVGFFTQELNNTANVHVVDKNAKLFSKEFVQAYLSSTELGKIDQAMQKLQEIALFAQNYQKGNCKLNTEDFLQLIKTFDDPTLSNFAKQNNNQRSKSFPIIARLFDEMLKSKELAFPLMEVIKDVPAIRDVLENPTQESVNDLAKLFSYANSCIENGYHIDVIAEGMAQLLIDKNNLHAVVDRLGTQVSRLRFSDEEKKLFKAMFSISFKKSAGSTSVGGMDLEEDYDKIISLFSPRDTVLNKNQQSYMGIIAENTGRWISQARRSSPNWNIDEFVSTIRQNNQIIKDLTKLNQSHINEIDRVCLEITQSISNMEITSYSLDNLADNKPGTLAVGLLMGVVNGLLVGADKKPFSLDREKLRSLEQALTTLPIVGTLKEIVKANQIFFNMGMSVDAKVFQDILTKTVEDVKKFAVLKAAGQEPGDNSNILIAITSSIQKEIAYQLITQRNARNQEGVIPEEENASNAMDNIGKLFEKFVENGGVNVGAKALSKLLSVFGSSGWVGEKLIQIPIRIYLNAAVKDMPEDQRTAILDAVGPIVEMLSSAGGAILAKHDIEPYVDYVIEIGKFLTSKEPLTENEVNILNQKVWGLINHILNDFDELPAVIQSVMDSLKTTILLDIAEQPQLRLE